jgi:hypothetical protein
MSAMLWVGTLSSSSEDEINCSSDIVGTELALAGDEESVTLGGFITLSAIFSEEDAVNAVSKGI